MLVCNELFFGDVVSDFDVLEEISVVRVRVRGVSVGVVVVTRSRSIKLISK